MSSIVCVIFIRIIDLQLWEQVNAGLGKFGWKNMSSPIYPPQIIDSNILLSMLSVELHCLSIKQTSDLIITSSKLISRQRVSDSFLYECAFFPRL